MKTKIVVASLVLGAAATGIAHAEQVVTIAISGPLTGPQSVSGKDDENGLRLAIESLNRKPIQVGGQPVRFRMMSEDDQADPRTGVQVAQRLLDQRPVAFFGPQNSGVAIPVARLTSAARVPMLTVASNPQLTTLGYDNLFRTGASDSVLGASMAAFAAGKLGAKTAAVIDDRTAYGQGLAEQFIDKAKSLGLQVVAREFTHSQANDFLGILATIKGKNPDVIFFGGYTAQAAPMARQMVQRGVRAKLLGGDGICSVNMAQVAQAASRNVFCAMSGTGLEGTEPGRDYIARYRARFKSEPQTYGITYYDGMMLLAKTMEAAQTTDPAKLIPALRSASHRGVAATYAFTKQGELLDAPTTVFTFENGQMTPVR
ncbi:branched chain amino acid ABC transporter substrate-binding protein [Burkholderia pseudomultivorans]|uniref:branched-chain amino acid ABC transporter substrate-binding protein n=1 Tax=Burkholderia pseudomultivorans TaxID=1207504 RepID=UPI000751BC85|nr:branched-chain amino acid ABC transporter substrate-binding protein [Burkholderia pseudomultivorans]KWI50418.1 branched chain amino acid ABC transporter substrate-binding protein [Burkholderia pseudomultivorans]